jgi:integrase
MRVGVIATGPMAGSRKWTIGDASKISIDDARRLARKAAAGLAENIDPGAEKKRLRIAARTPIDLDKVETVAATFIKRHVVNLAPATQREVNRILEKEIVRTWRGRRLSSIGKPEIHNLLDKITDRGAPIYANRVLMWFRALGNFAIGRGLIEVNPCIGVGMPAIETARDRVLSDAELAALWEAASALPHPYGAFILILILTGQRRNEVAGMGWSEIDLAAKLWTLPGARAKNGKEHSIPLSEAACSILKTIPRIKGCDFVFTVNGRGAFTGHHNIKRWIDKLIPPGTPPWVLHDIRRTVATGMAAGRRAARCRTALEPCLGQLRRNRWRLSAL